nr:DEAD/DEAH box helicase [Clostridiales bacterium]
MSNKPNTLPCAVSPIKGLKEYRNLLANIISEAKKPRPLPMTVTGLCEGARSALYAALASDIRSGFGQGFLLIVPEEKDAVRLQNVFSDCGMKALIYPLRDFVFHNIVASHEYEHQRIAVLDAVLSGDFDIVITTPDAALQYTMPPSALHRATVTIDDGSSDWSTQRLSSLLVSAGYVRVDMVDGVGEFSVRGGIVDIWPPSASNPVRIDFFGDEIEQMSEFDMLSQRTIERISSVYITPARETSVPDEKRGELKDAVSALRKKTGALKIGTGAGAFESAAAKNSAVDALSGEISAIDGGEIGFSDKYISLIYDEKICLLDYFRDSVLIGVQEYNACMERAKAFEWHERQNIETLLSEYAVSGEYAEYSRPAQYLAERVDAGLAMTVDLFTTGQSGRKLSGIFTFRTKQTPAYAHNKELILEDLFSYGRVGYDVVIMTESESAAQAVKSWLSDNGITAAVTSGEPADGLPTVIWNCDISGYELPEAKFAALSTLAAPNSLSRIPASRKKGRGTKKSAQEKIMSYADLSPGDLVVHQSHGIGRYVGLHTLTIDGVTRDYMKIQYAGTDVVYIPCDKLDRLSKYIGAHGEDSSVKLSRIGGAEWARAKQKAKGAAKDMAKKLIQLYAERLRTPGYAFGEDDDMQRQFEDSFEYDETDGQLEAVDEIKRDMQRPNPMDRLLCGDVGFGKTEVALRAAFKCVDCGKQCVMLVPTTILAMQHYQTLQTRMRGYPVTVEMLSRFRQPKQQAEIIRRLRRGEIDILVGTHRILSKDIQFKDLGLVIVDEEQRFGVAQKEKLKQLSKNVDVLTLTATPIPRTLNMAMSGIRDMSVLEEAPGDRLPV